MRKDLIEKCNKYIKKGKVDKLYDYIIQNDLVEEFVTQVFNNTYMKRFEGKEYGDAINISNFALKISIDSLKEKYGENLANRFAQIIYDMPQPSQRNYNLFRLMKSQIKNISEETQDTIGKILDMSSNGENVIGTHIIGADIGHTLAREGINLTGHKFVVNDYSDRTYKSDVRGTLQKNITFFENDSISLAMQLIDSRTYNNPVTKLNDIMIISIPKEELKKNEEGIIIEKEQEKYLNPIYIKGFARVEVESGNIENFVNNPSFRERDNIQKDVKSLSVDDWKNKFEEWYEISRTTKMQRIKLNVLNFFKREMYNEKSRNNNEQER